MNEQLKGAFLVDKDPGITSAGVVRRLKRASGVKRIGHAGTLDPMASGLLVVLCGKATRLQSLIMDGEKVYQGLIRLGIATSTDDVEGEVVERDEQRSYLCDGSEEELLRRITAEFSGELQQVPPVVSAVKVDGQRSYRLARQGKAAELAPRRVFIESLELSFREADLLEYRVRCSKGTYVRSLARDIGRFLGSCACLESIRRLESSPFSIGQARSLEQIESAENFEDCLVDIRELVSHLPRAEFAAKEVELLHLGNQEPLHGLELEDNSDLPLAALYSAEGGLEGILHKEAANSWRIRFML